MGSIANTRHNLTMSYMASTIMDGVRNQYFEVCVYCHTPHGSNSEVAAPLWNRSKPLTNYQLFGTYNKWGDVSTDTRPRRNYFVGNYDPLTFDQPVGVPGPNSLTCLSCHDGSLSVDTIINMPTRPTGAMAGYSPTPNESFLDSWDGLAVTNRSHAHLANSTDFSCLSCHSSVFRDANSPPGAPPFDGFEISEASDELRNDHPIGITYPTINTRPDASQPAYTDVSYSYNEPVATTDSLGRVTYFFDRNGSGKMDKNEVRLYNSGDGPKVECASCHDPHGIPSNGEGSQFIPSFLRVSNSGVINDGIGQDRQTLCETCHNK